MAYDLKYGEVTVEHEPGNPLNGEDEIVVVFRGRDELLFPLLYRYKNLARNTMEEGAKRQVSQEFIQQLDKLLEAVGTWQDNHPDLLKLPD